MKGKRGRSGAGWGGAGGGWAGRVGERAEPRRSLRGAGADLPGAGSGCAAGSAQAGSGQRYAFRASTAPLHPVRAMGTTRTRGSRSLKETRPVCVSSLSSAGAEQATGMMKMLGKNMGVGERMEIVT